MSELSVLCVTRVEPHARPFLDGMLALAVKLGAELVLACDGDAAMMQCVFNVATIPVRFVCVDSAGYVESVLDRAVEACSRDYVLRLDDDERCSPAMARWLERRSYETANHWKFPRAHLWGDEHHFLATPQLWPDHQTRLSVKRMAGGRGGVHDGSPYGGGHEAPCAIEHHKLLVKSVEERREIVRRYDAIRPGAGRDFLAFNVPEEFYTEAELCAATANWNGGAGC